MISWWLAIIQPFRPFRYSAKAGDPALLLTQPYDKISPAMRERYLAASPYNLVRVILDEQRDHARAARQLNEWIHDGILAQDAVPGLYAYFQEFEAKRNAFGLEGSEPFGKDTRQLS